MSKTIEVLKELVDIKNWTKGKEVQFTFNQRIEALSFAIKALEGEEEARDEVTEGEIIEAMDKEDIYKGRVAGYNEDSERLALGEILCEENINRIAKAIMALLKGKE